MQSDLQTLSCECRPVRTEEMSREVMDACLTFAKEQKIATIDITGGAPEMNPNLEYLIEEKR